MKKIHMIAALLTMLLPTVTWADSSYKYEISCNVSKTGTGSGTVYCDPSSPQTGTTSTSGEDVTKTFTITATPDANNKFTGWTKTGTGTIKDSSSQSTTVSITATSSSKTPTANVVANFVRYYNVTLDAPDVSAGFDGYTYSGDGISGTQSSSGGTPIEANAGKDYTFTCNLKNTGVYKVDGWSVGGALLQPTSSNETSTTLKTQFTADATVKVVLSKKEHYSVTLAAPEITGGFNGYTVTGAGISGTLSLSEGNITAYKGGEYTITCALKNTDIYEFVEWEITENGVTTKKSERELKQKFTAAATVRAVLNKKAQYTLTLQKPTGVDSYTVAPESLGLSSGGTVTLFGANTCTFDCNLDDNYRFVKWTVTDSSGSHDYTTRPLTQTFASSDVTVKAVVRPKETYELTLAKPEGVVSYAVTGPGGAAVSVSEAGKTNVREVDSYTFECTINDVEYTFVKWLVTDSSGNQIQESRDRIFTTDFPSAATVTAVLHKKEIYEVTFTKPTGVTSYAMTGPDGAVTISAEGKASVYESDSYTISCTYDDDNYEFTKWVATDSSGTVQPTTSTLTKTFTSAATVTVVLTEACIAKCLPVPSDCSYKVKQGNSTQQTVTTSEVKFRGNLGQTLKVTLSSAKAGGNYQFVGWYRLYKNGVKEYLSYYQSASVEVSDTVGFMVGAEFQEVKDSTIHFAAPVDGKINYSISGGSSGVVEDEDKDVDVQAGKSVTLTAVSDYESRRAKWYMKDESNTKMYFSIDNTVTRQFTSSATLGVDFIPVNTNIMNAIEAAQSSTAHEAILAADAEIVLGSSVEIPEGIRIDLNGHTLYVDGTLTVNGTLTGGTVSRCTKLIRQTGNGLEPIVAGNISYWDTRVETSQASVSGFSNNASHLTIVNGYGVSIRGTLSNSSPAAIVCQIDLSGNSVNTITNFVGDYSRIGGGSGGAIYAAGKYSSSNNKIVVQLASSVSLNINNDFPADSNNQWQATKSGQPNGKLGNGYRIDCAHNSISVNYEFTNASTTYFINAATAERTGGYLLSATENFINCTTVTQRINANSVDYTVRFNVYDCGNPTISISGSSIFKTAGCGVNFRSGGPYTIPSSGNSNYHVYGGFYTSKPDSGRIALENPGSYKFCQHADTYWYLEENLDPNVAEIGGVKKEYLVEAFQEAITGSAQSSTITLLKDCSLDEAVVIPSNRTIRVELAGCKVTAPNGFAVNQGTLEIGDKYGRMSYCGIITENGNMFVNEDGGKIKIAYGKYEGSSLLKAGSEFITYNGIFNGTFSFADGVTDKSSVAKFYGGKFSANVTDCLSEGYQQVNGYVGLFPYADIRNESVSGYEFGYRVQAMNSDDLNLYNSSYTMRDSHYTDETWFRRAMLYSQSAPYLNYSIDCVICFDRDVARNSVVAYGKTTLGQSQELSEDVAAGVDYRVLSTVLASKSQYQKSYSLFITEDSVKTLICAVNNSVSVNRGTLCVLRIDLCSGANKYDVSNLRSIYTIGRRSFVFGAGSNKAMIRPTTGAADFYSLQGAIDVVKNNGGGTVMLANNCNEIPSFDTAGTYIVDSMGFEHSFSGAKGGYTVAEGLSVTTEPVTSSVTALIPGATAIKYVVSDPVTKVVIDGEPATTEEQADLRQEDTNGNAHWQNYVMGQDGATAAAIVTSTNGTETVAEVVVSFEVPSKNTGYTVKYAFDEVDAEDKVIEAGAVQDKPQLDLTKVTKASEPHYFKMRTVLESTDHTVTSEVPVEHTVGVMKVASDATFTILAVPWKSFDGGNVKVSELVHAASLSTDDMLYAYDGNGNLESWRVKGGVWVPATDVVDGAQTPKSDPAAFGLARGKGVWLKRKDTTKPIYLMGMPPASTDAATTTLTAPASGETSWNLLASPKLEAVNFGKFNTGDEIIVPTAGTPKHYTYKNGAWGYPGATVTSTKKLPNGQTIQVISVEHKTDDTTITPGTGFWYLNKDGEKTISW